MRIRLRREISIRKYGVQSPSSRPSQKTNGHTTGKLIISWYLCRQFLIVILQYIAVIRSQAIKPCGDLNVRKIDILIIAARYNSIQFPLIRCIQRVYPAGFIENVRTTLEIIN